MAGMPAAHSCVVLHSICILHQAGPGFISNHFKIKQSPILLGFSESSPCSSSRSVLNVATFNLHYDTFLIFYLLLYSIEKKESIHLGNQNRWIRGPGADGTLH
jgi:hypothetical protein